jgi:DHA1 family bicyclomycin/chloramphenicol resistance-like MFS transporter
MPVPPDERAPLATVVVATALALLLGLQPLTTDLYLQALPMLARDLQAPMSAVQLTMSALILAFGVAQLACGPLADRYGRRPVLLAGLGLYTAASVAATLAPTIAWLVAARTLQGAAMAAAVVCSRAMVRDLYEPGRGAHVMSQGLSGLGVIAIAGPPLGGLLAAAWGWRSTLAAVTLAGLLVWLFVWRALPETIVRKNPRALHVAPLAAAARAVLRHPTFIAWTGLVSATYGGLFTVLAASSFVYIDVLGLSPAAYGAAMASGSVSYFAATFVCRRWLLAHGLAGAVKRGALFTLAGGVSGAVLAAAGVQTVWAVLVPQWLFAFGHGIHQPCGQAGAVGPFPHAAGVASALAGCTLALVSFGIGLWLGAALDGTTRPMAYGMALWATITAVLAWTLVQRHGATPVARAVA